MATIKMITFHTTAIIVAGGVGSRLGADKPKAFVSLGGTPLFLHSLRTFLTHPMVEETVLVVHPSMHDEAERIFDESGLGEDVVIVNGGEHRWQSVKNGAAKAHGDWVLVHDAARPFVTHAVIDDVLVKRAKYECVITATPETDTIRHFSDDLTGTVVDRSKLIRVGTPQLFRRKRLRELLDTAEGKVPPPTDEAVLVQEAGIEVGFAWGDPLNFKITTAADMAIAEAMLYKQHR